MSGKLCKKCEALEVIKTARPERLPGLRDGVAFECHNYL